MAIANSGQRRLDLTFTPLWPSTNLMYSQHKEIKNLNNLTVTLR